MVPQVHSETILVLGINYESLDHTGLSSFTLNTKKMMKEGTTSYPDFEGHSVFFLSNQFKISNDGKTIVTITRDDDAQYNSSNILIEFKTAGHAIKMLDEDMSLASNFQFGTE